MQRKYETKEITIRNRFTRLGGIFLLILPLLLAAMNAFALKIHGGHIKGMDLSAKGGTVVPPPDPPPPPPPPPDPGGTPGDVTGGTVDPKQNAYHTSWYENIYPRAMYKNGKTFITYHCYNFDTCARAYNNQTKTWEKPVWVGTNSIGGFANSHGNPAVFVDHTGQVHVFYGAQQTSLKYSRTTTPGDLRTLKAQPAIGTNITYPQAMELSDGKIWLFHRSAGAGYDFCYRTSADGGKTWSSTVQLINSSEVWYGFASKGQNDKIHMVFHVYNRVGTANYPRENVYYMYRNPTDGKWYNINDKPVTVPITTQDYANANCRIYNSNGIHTDLDRVRETVNGNLYIGWIEDHSYKMLVHNGTSFEPVRSLSFPDEPPLNQADFWVENNFKIKLYLSVKGGEIGLWESTDQGANWTKKVAQLSGTVHPKKVRVPMVIDDHPPEEEVIYYTATDKYEEGKMYMWGPNGYILKQP